MVLTQNIYLEITVQYIGRVNVFQSAKYLINEILNMIDCKRLFTVDYAM